MTRRKLRRSLPSFNYFCEVQHKNNTLWQGIEITNVHFSFSFWATESKWKLRWMLPAFRWKGRRKRTWRFLTNSRPIYRLARLVLCSVLLPTEYLQQNLPPSDSFARSWVKKPSIEVKENITVRRMTLEEKWWSLWFLWFQQADGEVDLCCVSWLLQFVSVNMKLEQAATVEIFTRCFLAWCLATSFLSEHFHSEASKFFHHENL